MDLSQYLKGKIPSWSEFVEQQYQHDIYQIRPYPKWEIPRMVKMLEQTGLSLGDFCASLEDGHTITLFEPKGVSRSSIEMILSRIATHHEISISIGEIGQLLVRRS